jgi:DUF3089 family protein
MRKIALSAALAALGAGILAASGSAKAVWLCKPGQQPDPCISGLSTTVYSADLRPLRVEHPKAVHRPAIDCFYVYPAAADLTQTSGNRFRPRGRSSLRVDSEERSIAVYQAARFSQYCRLFAPVYRVSSSGAGGAATKANLALPFADVKAALVTYLKLYNHRRGFVLIGSGEGAEVLRALIHLYVDPHPLLRRLLVSAILVGGDVLVKAGSGSGGDFRHVPACRSATQLGCVIAYSMFDQPPPRGSEFGRVPPFARHRHDAVLCTNPAGLGGHTGRLKPIFPNQPFDPQNLISRLIASYQLSLPTPATSWIAEPGAFRARCSTAHHTTVLELTPVAGAVAPVPSPNTAWGLHYLDINLALGNLISIVRREAVAYGRRNG